MLGELRLQGCYALLEVRAVVYLQEAAIGVEIFVNELTYLVKEL